MQPVELKQGLLPSILDRLIDPESAGNAIMIGYNEARMSEAVRRDLEDLLNTRQTFRDLPDDLKELPTSVLAYGLPDLASVPAITSAERNAIGRYIEEVIRRHEPRLRDVRATLLEDTPDPTKPNVRFRIDARLCVDPAPDVAFDTILEMSTGHYAVRQVEE